MKRLPPVVKDLIEITAGTAFAWAFVLGLDALGAYLDNRNAERTRPREQTR